MTKRSSTPKSGTPYCMRLTDEERHALQKAAAGTPLSTYIKSILFGRDLPPVRRRGATPVKDHQELAKLLALLGQSRIANNLNQLAKAANSGSLPVNASVCAALTESCEAIRGMRGMLLTSLGLNAPSSPSTNRKEPSDDQ